jgi:hypothetical protein
MAGFSTQNVMLSQIFSYVYFVWQKKWTYLSMSMKVFDLNNMYQSFYQSSIWKSDGENFKYWNLLRY